MQTNTHRIMASSLLLLLIGLPGKRIIKESGKVS